MQKSLEYLQSFRGIHDRFSRIYSKFLTDLDLTIQQYAVMNVLHDAGPLSMHEVSLRIGVSKPAVTYIADKLEKKKFLQRMPHAEDRRSYLLELLEKGRQVVGKAHEIGLVVMAETLEEFPAGEREIVKKFYDVMKIRMDQNLARPEEKHGGC